MNISSKIAILLIEFYQKHISPHKGFHCAHNFLHSQVSCSEYSRRVIGRVGLRRGMIMVFRRLRECRLAELQIQLLLYLYLVTFPLLTGCEEIGKLTGKGSGECCVGCVKGCS